MEIYSFFNHPVDLGEVNSGEMITEPGQSFTTREIYERFLFTGRVEGSIRKVSYDTDEIKDPQVTDIIPRPLDFTDIDDQMEELYRLRAERVAQAQKEELAKRTLSQGTIEKSDAVKSPNSE